MCVCLVAASHLLTEIPLGMIFIGMTMVITAISWGYMPQNDHIPRYVNCSRRVGKVDTPWHGCCFNHYHGISIG